MSTEVWTLRRCKNLSTAYPTSFRKTQSGNSILRSFVALLVVFALSCNSSDEDSAPSVKNRPRFGFDFEAVTQLDIAKNDPEAPETDSRWMARLRRVGTQPPEWEVQSGPHGETLLDKRADAKMILHLLDTLRTLDLRPSNLKGSKESFGLASPRYQLRWTERKETPRVFSLSLGNPTTNFSAYAATDTEENTAWIAQGATLAMLQNIPSFSTLRQRKWISWDADDVEEVEIKRANPKYTLKFQRSNGRNWGSPENHRAVRSNPPLAAAKVDAWLEGVVHLRVLNFIDDAQEAATLRSKIQHDPIAEIRLLDHRNASLTLRVLRQNRRVYGVVSDRPDAVFELYPESMRFFEGNFK